MSRMEKRVMNLKDIPKEELESMSYDEIAYLVLEKNGKKMKLLDLFKKVCKVLDLPEETVEERIADFFELLSINKKFVLLPNGYWDLSTNHVQDMVVEDEEDTEVELEEDTEDTLEDEENEEDDIFYDTDLDDSDDDDDDLKDLVIIDDEENMGE